MEVLLLWGFGLLAAAIIIMIVEMFVPTAGVLTVTAIVVSMAGVVCLFQHSQTFGFIGVGLVLIGGPTLFFVGLQIMPETPLGRKLVLGAEDAPEGPWLVQEKLNKLVGAEGEVITDLRPIGRIKIEQEKFDALAESSLIRAGSRVKVVGVVDGSTLKVRVIS